MKKAALMLLFVVLFVSAFAGSASAAIKPPKLYLNGKEMKSATATHVENNTTYVPIRTVAEGMGFKVDWDAASQKVDIHNGNDKVELFINNKVANVNSLPVTMISPAKIMNEVTMVPLRFVSENLGVQVYFDSPSNIVYLYQQVEADTTSSDSAAARPTASPAAADSPLVAQEPARDSLGTENSVQEPKGGGFSTKPPAQQSETAGPGTVVAGDPSSISTDPAEAGNILPVDAGDLAVGGNKANISYHAGSGGAANWSLAPLDAASLITSIQFDGLGTTTISFEGAIQPVTPIALNEPNRIVLDLPAAAFADTFMQGYSSPDAKVGEIIVANGFLDKIRYSYYSDNPSTVRVVWDLSAAAQFYLNQTNGMIQLGLMAMPGQAGQTLGSPTPPVIPPGGKTYTVVIDAGHGGKDPGAIGVSNRNEKSYNLAVALKVNELLKKDPRIQPILTRSDDTFIELDQRAAIANQLNADVFISIHANALPGSSASGTETYYNRPNSKSLADIIHRHLLQATGLPDRKVQTAGFVVIKKTTMPAVLTESGFLTNAKDEAILFDEQKQQQIAQALVDGIKEYLKLS